MTTFIRRIFDLPGSTHRLAKEVALSLFFAMVPVSSLQADQPVSSQCPHVKVLTRGQNALVEEPYRHKIKNPGPNQREALKAALDALPPVVCQSVQMVVFLDDTLASAPEALAWVGKSRPSLINISAVPGGASEERLDLDLSDIPGMDEEENQKRKESMVKIWPEVIHSIIHEAYHCATHLLDSFSPDAVEPRDGHGWPASAKQVARPLAEKARVIKGFRSEWERVNREFADLEFGSTYENSRVGRKEEPPKGFMTIYGGKSAGEDIAEAASWAVAKPILESTYAGVRPDVSEWKNACTKMRAHQGDGIPPQYAALYTKLSFLRDVGFITEEILESCAGSIALKGTEGGDGFHYFNYDTGEPFTSYKTDFQVQRKPDTLNISAWGHLKLPDKSLPAVTELEFWVEDPALPRGIYAIDRCNDYIPFGTLPFASSVKFRRDVVDNRSQSICAYKAKVLVTSATVDRIEGAAVLQKVWKFSAPPVPEVAGFPVRVVFTYKR